MNKNKYLTLLLIGLTLTCCSGCNKNTSSTNGDSMAIHTTEQLQTESQSETIDTNEKTEPVTQIVCNVDDYVRVLDYIPDIVVDLKYATADNFTGQVIYNFNEAYLRYGTVVKLKEAQQLLKEQGYRIKIWDAYRPFSAQEKMWAVYPNPNYVADPAKGMRGHNLGNTIDITIVTIDGSEVTMPTDFDDFSTRADRNYSEIEPEAASHAQLLENIMTQCDFKGYRGEWWDYTDNTTYSEITNFEPKE